MNDKVEAIIRQIFINICVDIISIKAAKDSDWMLPVIMSYGGVDVDKHVKKVTIGSPMLHIKTLEKLGHITGKEYAENLSGLEELRLDIQELLEQQYDTNKNP